MLNEIKIILYRSKGYLILLVVLAVLLLGTTHAVQNIITGNMRRMGDSLAHSYSVEEERKVIGYRMLMELGTRYLQRQLQETMGKEGQRELLQRFFRNAIAVTGGKAIDPYAVVDGRIIAASPWEGDASYAVTYASWYQQAIAAGGKVVFSDAYKDAITGRPVITIAQKSSDTDDVMAFDVFPEQFRDDANTHILPERSSYYLFDSKGVLLYHKQGFQTEKGDLADYVEPLFRGIQDGSLLKGGVTITDVNGVECSVHCTIADNGWISVVTIPIDVLLADFYFARTLYSLLLAGAFVIIVVLGVRNYLSSRREERTNETVRVLGNSYYAIYRVNLNTASYDMIKGSDYGRRNLKQQGSYEDLLHVVSELINHGVTEKFNAVFALENIRELVRHRISNFGGDFQRYFNHEYHWVNVRVLFDESLNPGEVVLCFRDVEEEKQVQLKQMELLQNAVTLMKESNEAQSRFFSNMSHDMRTPLNAIIGFATLALKSLDDKEKINDYLQKIQCSSSQLLGLVNDALELSKIEQGKLIFDNKEFNLRDVLSACCEAFKMHAEEEDKKFSLAFDIQNEMVEGDPMRLSQVVNNILSNAFKYSRGGDSIRMDVKQVDGTEHAKYQIVVADTGVGMSEEFLEKLFGPYEREENLGAKGIPGTGLGMPIVQSILLQMGGHIAVSSKQGAGTTVTMTIPLKALQGQGDTNTEAADEDDGYSLEGKAVLLAEDNDFNMEIATDLLEMMGAKVIPAVNGREAVARFEESEPHSITAILMDMQMPEMNGCDAARAIRALDRPDAATVPIIAVTANAFAEDISATTEAGMNAHISKPIDFDIFKKTLKKLSSGTA